MAKHVIFLIHGMGVYVQDGDGKNRVPSTTWFDTAERAIVSAYNSHETLKAEPFDSRFEVVRINYDAYFDEILKNTRDSAAKLKQLLPGTFLSHAADFIEQSAPIEDNFFWTHALDVVLYTFIEDIRMAIKSHVAARIVETVIDKRATDWSVVAHSLGTIVANDALQAMNEEFRLRGWSGAWPRAKVVAMIANVTRAVEDTRYGPAYGERIRPGPMSASLSYLSAGHKLDPFVLANPFNPEGDPGWTDAYDPYAYYRFYRLHGLSHFQPSTIVDEDGEIALSGFVPHQFAHYFASPRVHLTYFSRVAPWANITAKTIEAANTKFAKANKRAAYAILEDRLEGVLGGAEFTGEARDRWKRYAEFIRFALERLEG